METEHPAADSARYERQHEHASNLATLIAGSFGLRKLGIIGEKGDRQSRLQYSADLRPSVELDARAGQRRRLPTIHRDFRRDVDVLVILLPQPDLASLNAFDAQAGPAHLGKHLGER